MGIQLAHGREQYKKCQEVKSFSQSEVLWSEGNIQKSPNRQVAHHSPGGWTREGPGGKTLFGNFNYFAISADLFLIYEALDFTIASGFRKLY